MPLTLGTRLGVYEITALIGEGGMGQVFRAHDTKLNRDVALKVLPDSFADDADRLARFTREAQTLASLNHPNIAHIHGLEESGGVRALVMELVEGEDLSQRIVRGALPLDEALPIAKQIAEALEAAHEQGIIHRDLKPANIKVRADGTVKVLDFGLAKVLDPISSASGNATMSPTITNPAMTRMGVIMGTAAYMSPEQAKGKVVDKRADIWAFGCVLFELLTGRQAFVGETVTELLGAIMHTEPEWTKLQPDTPAAVRRMLRRCLTKDPRQRMHDIADMRVEIEALGREPAEEIVNATLLPRKSWRQFWWLAAAGIAAGILFGVAAERWLRPPRDSSTMQVQAPLLRATINLSADAPLALGTLHGSGYDSPAVAVSPDGRSLVYVGKSGAGTILFLRQIASDEVRPIAGTEGAIYAFFSPNGEEIGFLTNYKVMKARLQGGAPTPLCEARLPILAWWHEDTIYFTEDEAFRVSRVSQDGGKPSSVIASGKVSVSFSDVLPDGKSFLGVSEAGGIGGDYSDIVLVDVDTLATKVLVRQGYGARYVPRGGLVFARSGILMAIAFDLDRKEVVGDAVPVATGAMMESLFGMVHAAYSNNGMIAYVPGGDLSVGTLAWVDRKARVENLDTPPRVYGSLDLSPDGKRIAVQVADVKNYVWVYDIGRHVGQRLPSTDSAGWPVWDPEGRRVAVAVRTVNQPTTVLVRDPDASSFTQQVASFPGLGLPNSWSLRGNVLALMTFDSAWHTRFASLGNAIDVPTFEGWFPSFSPDGRWLAYASKRTGSDEVFIRSFPDGKIERQVSDDGGLEPLWNASGELFYRNGNRWKSTHVSTAPELKWDPPRLVFDTEFIDTPGMSYDVSRDGQRLLVVKRARPVSESRINLIVNWFEALPSAQVKARTTTRN